MAGRPAIPGKVVQIGPAPQVRGGISSVERLILEALSRRTAIEQVATMDDRNHLRRAWLYLRAVRRLRVLLQAEQPLVFHVHFASRGSTLRKYIISRMVLRTPHRLVLHAHGAGFDEFFRTLPKILRKTLSSTFAAADAFVVLSTQWRSFYTDELGLPGERTWVLLNPTRPPGKVPDRTGRDRVQFVFLGRIGDRKGAFDLLEAYRALPPAVRARTRMVFAGDGRVEELRRRARQVGPDVTVHSWLTAEQRDELLADSDVLVLPSLQEGVPMAILEGMSYGLPVIATPVGGIPDVITDQKEGLLVDVGDRPALTAAMEQLAVDSDRRELLGSHAHAKAQSLDIAHYTDRLIQVYRSVMDR
jgi:glycosyltransferase involved in cell wall biosynthesis